jgi:hypothetical protein
MDLHRIIRACERLSYGVKSVKRRNFDSPECLQDTSRVSSRHFPTVFKTLPECLQDTPQVSSRHFPSVFKTLPECLQDTPRVSSSRKQNERHQPRVRLRDAARAVALHSAPSANESTRDPISRGAAESAEVVFLRVPASPREPSPCPISRDPRRRSRRENRSPRVSPVGKKGVRAPLGEPVSRGA